MNHVISKRFWLVVFLLSLFILYLNNGSIGLWDQDESAYAGFALRMIESGNWLTPEFTWSDIHRKPPLHFWTLAASFKLFGYNEWAVRFPSTLAILLTILAVYLLGKDVFGKSNSQIASLLLFCCPLPLALGKISVTDATLLLFETVSMLSIFHYAKSGRGGFLLLLLIGNAGGLLTKGPPVWIISIGTLGILFLFRKYRIRTLKMAGICLLASLPLLIWGKMAWETDQGKFISWMADWYILKRNKGVLGQTGPPGYFLMLFLAGMGTFAMFFLPGLKDTVIGFFKKEARKEETIFLFSWMAAGWWVYEFIPSKLPAYAIGALPAIAFIIAENISGFLQGGCENKKWFIAGIAFYLLLGLAEGGGLIAAGTLLMSGINKYVVFAFGALLLVLTFYCAYHLFTGNKPVIRLLFIQALVVPLTAFLFIIPALETKRSVTKSVAGYIADNFSKTTGVVFTKGFPQPSLPFYLAASGFNYTEDPEAGQWAEALSKGSVLILDDSNYPLLTNMALDKKLLREKRFDGFVSDRGKNISYFVVSISGESLPDNTK